MWCVLIACVCGKCWPGLFGVFEFLGLVLCEWGVLICVVCCLVRACWLRVFGVVCFVCLG